MMKLHDKILIGVALLMGALSLEASAQNHVQTAQKITLMADQSLETWKLSLASDAYDDVWIDWNGDGAFQSGEEVTAETSSELSREVSARSLSIYGVLTQFNCSYNTLVSLSVENQSQLHSLNCANNQLSQIVLTEMPSLKELFIHSNKLGATSLMKVIDVLADNSQNDDASIYVFDSFAGDENVCTKEAVARALSKGWQVFDYRSGQDPRPYVGVEDPASKYTTDLPYVELTRMDEEEWHLFGEMNYANASVAWVDWNMNGQYDAGEETPDFEEISHPVVSKTIRLYGVFNQLSFAFNSVESVKVERQTLLSGFACMGNHLSAKMMDLIVTQLPDWSTSDESGEFYAFFSGNKEREHNVCPKSVVEKLKSKGWIAYQQLYENDDEFTEYDGSDEFMENPYSADQPSITLKRTESHGEWGLSLDIAPAYLSSAWIDWSGDGVYQQGEELTSLDPMKKVAEGTSLTLYGMVKRLTCTGNGIVTITPENQTSLASIHCQHNAIENDAFMDLLAKLPNFAQTSRKGTLVVFDSSASGDEEKNVCLQSSVRKALLQGWKVYAFNGNDNELIAYEGFDDASVLQKTPLIRISVKGTCPILSVGEAMIGQRYGVYSVAGDLVCTGILSGETEPLPDMPFGRYILQVGDLSLKVCL